MENLTIQVVLMKINKNITVEPLFENYKKDNRFIHRLKTQKLYLI
jgi:hypothetical protein